MLPLHSLYKYWIIITILAVSALFPWPSAAEMEIPDESFPDSRFGVPAGAPGKNLTPDFLARQVDELDGDSGSNAASRGIASVTGPAKAPEVQALAPQSSDATPLSPISKPVLYQRKGVQEVALIAGDLGFFPKTVFVTRDLPVRLFVTGASKNTLCLMMDSFQVRKQVRSRKIEEISFTPTFPGQYRFYCPINGMEGTLIVRELATETDGAKTED